MHPMIAPSVLDGLTIVHSVGPSRHADFARLVWQQFHPQAPPPLLTKHPCPKCRCILEWDDAFGKDATGHYVSLAGLSDLPKAGDLLYCPECDQFFHKYLNRDWVLLGWPE